MAPCTVRLHIQQKAWDFRNGNARTVESSLFVLDPSWDSTFVPEKQIHGFGATRAGGPQERRLSLEQRTVGIGAGRQQPLDEGRMTIERCQPKRGRPEFVDGIGLRSSVEKDIDHVEIVPVGRPVQRCRAVWLRAVHVDLLVQQPLYRRHIPRSSSLDKPLLRARERDGSSEQDKQHPHPSCP